MKTNRRFLHLASLAIALGALVTQSAVAQVANTLTLEETSSTSLTATYTTPFGSGVAAISPGSPPDTWTIFVPTAIFTAGPLFWIEPEDPLLSNRVSFAQSFVLVASDFASVGSIADEATVDNVGQDVNNGFPINIVFDDDAATAETTPDTGSTLGLLGLALAGLFGANRIRSLRLA